MNFLEYNHKFADGPDSKEYMVLDDTITLENPYLQEIIMELAEEYNYSDKYRGVDYDIINRPPDKWLEHQIDRMTNQIEYNKSMINKYKNLLMVK
jgi:hypothetical protein